MSDWVAVADDRPPFEPIRPIGVSYRGVANLLGLTVWLIILSVSLMWRVPHLEAMGLFNDEGVYAMWAKLVAQGHPLYEETRAVQSPLFLEMVALAFRWGGTSLAVGRGVILMSFGLLALALSGLAYRSGGWLSALLALLALTLSPLAFTYSRLIMAEIPATMLAVFALVLALYYVETQKYAALMLSGFLLGLSFIMKALYPFVVIPIALLLLTQPKPLRQTLSTDFLGWGVMVIIPVLVPWFIYPPTDLYEQLILFRGQLRAAMPGSWAETRAQFGLFAYSHASLGLLTGLMLIITLIQAQARRLEVMTVIWWVWFSSAALTLLWHTPLFGQHFIVLLPPLVILSSLLPLHLYEMFKTAPRLGRIGAVFSLLALIPLPTMVKANQDMAAIVTGGRETDAIKFLQAVSQPHEFVMGDSQLLIFAADRQTPPPLGDVALVGIKAGLQTSDHMRTLTEQFQAPAVVQWSLRLPWLPDYLAWVQTHYLAKRVWDNDHIIYFVPRLAPQTPLPHAQVTPLGQNIALRGYEVSYQTPTELGLKVFWQTDTVLTEDYTIFTQLLNPQGQLVIGWDSQPVKGYFPTHQWPVHEIITDRVELPLPTDLPPGDYTLITGMYRLETLTRLTTHEGQDYISLGVWHKK